MGRLVASEGRFKGFRDFRVVPRGSGDVSGASLGVSGAFRSVLGELKDISKRFRGFEGL